MQVISKNRRRSICITLLEKGTQLFSKLYQCKVLNSRIMVPQRDMKGAFNLSSTENNSVATVTCSILC